MILKISSRKNDIIKYASKLKTDSDFRRKEGKFLSEGARLCRDAAESGIVIEAVFYTEKALEKYGDYLQTIFSTARNCYLIESHVADLLGDTKNPQGIFSICRTPAFGETVDGLVKTRKYIALQRLQDPGNLGTILRTAEALGINGVLLTDDCCDPFNPKSLRSGMGAAFRLPLYQMENGEQLVRELNSCGFFTFAAVPDRDAISVTDCGFSDGAVVFVGNEGNGLSKQVVELCQKKITIPMKGRAESLNAASSAAVLMWEMMR